MTKQSINMQWQVISFKEPTAGLPSVRVGSGKDRTRSDWGISD